LEEVIIAFFDVDARNFRFPAFIGNGMGGGLEREREIEDFY
tara:strand:- start:355 stop:477 length:123 start_codon:yes stop_codon:yes gene_type:complete